jgi:hypothetical protein
MCFVILGSNHLSLWHLLQDPAGARWLHAAALQFDLYRVKEDLDWHDCKVRPEDDRGARGRRWIEE